MFKVFLILYLSVPAKHGGTMPQYIPMETMEACKKFGPALAENAMRGNTIAWEEPTHNTQQIGGPIVKGKRSVSDHISSSRAHFKCVTIEAK